MVEMRDAPDPTVVLEIALVRLARPELDTSPAALLERLERLERAVASAPPAAPAVHAPATSAARPSLGELRRAGSNRPPPEPTPTPSTGKSTPAPDARDTPMSSAEQAAGGLDAAPAEPPAAAPTAADVAGDSVGIALDRDSLTIAWGDDILSKLSPRARALYQPGRFTEASAGSCTFAVPNEAHRAQCEKKRGEVEAALAGHFGAPIHVSLVVDRGAAPPPEDRPAVPALDEIDIDLDLEGGIAVGLGIDRSGEGARRLPRGDGGLVLGVSAAPPSPDRRARPPPRHRPQVRAAARLLPAPPARRGRAPPCCGADRDARADIALRDLLQRGGRHGPVRHLHGHPAATRRRSALWRTRATSSPWSDLALSAAPTTCSTARSARSRASAPTSSTSRSSVAVRPTRTVTEVILCTNPNVEGDATAMYLSRLLTPLRRRRDAAGERTARRGRPRVRRRCDARSCAGRTPPRRRLGATTEDRHTGSARHARSTAADGAPPRMASSTPSALARWVKVRAAAQPRSWPSAGRTAEA